MGIRDSASGDNIPFSFPLDKGAGVNHRLVLSGVPSEEEKTKINFTVGHITIVVSKVDDSREGSFGE